MKRLRLTPEAGLIWTRPTFGTTDRHPASPLTSWQPSTPAPPRSIAVAPSQPNRVYALVDATMHRALLRRFPYAIFYEIEPVQIVVYAVFHGARDPRAWRRRKDG